MKNNRINALVVMATIVIFFAVLATSLSLLLSSLQPHHNPLYAFAQIQKNVALSLSNLIKHGASYQGSTSAPVTLIDFSDLQCHLCDRFVTATEPQINSTYIQPGKVAFFYTYLIGVLILFLQPRQLNALLIKESFGNITTYCITIKDLLILDGQIEII
jgi:hypothetical protein